MPTDERGYEYDMKSGETPSWEMRRRNVFIYSQKLWFDDGRRKRGIQVQALPFFVTHSTARRICFLNQFSSSAVDKWTFKAGILASRVIAYTIRFIGC
jgi:hypothetical protein